MIQIDMKIPPECCINCKYNDNCTRYKMCKPYREWLHETWEKIRNRLKTKVKKYDE